MAIGEAPDDSLEDKGLDIFKMGKEYMRKQRQSASPQFPREEDGTNTAGVILHMLG